jgi:predicted transcriptional regulator
MAKNWDTVRKEAVAAGRVNEDRVAQHKERMLAEQRAYRLAEVRKAHGLTQVDVAKTMHVTQSRISAFEKGELAVSEVGTIAKYVEAIGGKLRLVADFGDEQVTVG